MEARDIRDDGPSAASVQGAAPKRDSGVRPVAFAERPTLPPPWRERAPTRLGSRRAASPAVDEVLYRLSVGDGVGAARVAEELYDAVPVRIAAPPAGRACSDRDLGLSEEYLLTLIDGAESCGALLSRSQLAAEDSLRGLCELVDRGLVTLW